MSCAFGVRNFQDLCAGFREMCRVLRRGGRVVHSALLLLPGSALPTRCGRGRPVTVALSAVSGFGKGLARNLLYSCTEELDVTTLASSDENPGSATNL